ncbi:hypothetical protein HU200_001353 [Digitaria exilis]|uniref:Uncharacterized protein n=1 Tax=Digitaria exilis TaxID=1010633 RepID=A0A835KV06_9POAL|nr:hypothetical protein HU200_001353 [Digitaria exilis]
MMRMARLALLLVFLIHAVNVLTAASAARPFKAEGWFDDGGIHMVVDMLGDNKSGPNPPSHCC